MRESRGVVSSLRSIQSILAFVTIVICLVAISYVSRNSFEILFTLYTISFLAFLFISRNNFKPNQIMLIALLLRVGLLISLPNLSDDIFRFIWDGRLGNESMTAVYAFLPSETLGVFEGCDQALFEQLNSKQYYSVYPPLMQLVLKFCAWVSGSNFMLNVVLIKVVLLVSEIALIYFIIKLLQHFSINIKWSYLYAFNPLVILESIGNCHFECLMLMFVAWSWLIMVNDKGTNIKTFIRAGFILGLGFMTKLTCLIFLPLLLRRIKLRNLILVGSGVILTSALLMLPFYSVALIENFSQSLDLYFRNFEFNASIYYLINYVLSGIKGFNTVQIVGPLLAMATVIVVGYLILIKKRSWKNYFSVCLLAYTSYLMFSTTVHPWYLINLVFLSALTGYKFPIMWSYLIVLSYFMYGNNRVEPTWILLIEYGVMVFFIWFEFVKPREFKSLLQFVPLFREDENLE